MLSNVKKVMKTPLLEKVTAAHLRRVGSHFVWFVMCLISVLLPFRSAIADPYVNGTFNFRHLLTAEQGVLGPGRITSIAQDKQGFIWIGGDNGLARYDGKNIRMFNYDEDDPDSISSNAVIDIDVDAQGRMWVIAGGKLNQYDRDREKFFRYNSLEFNSADEWIIKAAVDSKGALYIMSGRNVYTFDAHSNALTMVSILGRDMTEHIAEPNSLFIDRRDRLWLGSRIDGLLVSDLSGNQIRHWREASDQDVLHSNNVHTIFQDSLGNIWVATNLGVLKLDENLTNQKIFRHESNNPNSLGLDITEAVGEDRNGKIWIATWNSGISIYDPQSERFTQLRTNKQDPAGILSDATQIIFKDRLGDLWLVAYPLGIDYLDSNSYEVIRRASDPEDKNSLSNNGILCITSDARGGIWLGTQEGLNRYDPKTASFKRYLKDAKNVDESEGLKSSTILSIAQENQNELWIGTYGGGLHRFNTSTEKFIHYPAKSGPGGNKENIIWTILRDSESTIWIGTEQGLARYERASDSFRYYSEDLDPNRSVQSLHELSPEKLLVGTALGLYIFDKKLKRMSRVMDADSHLKSQVIADIIAMPNGHAWAATVDGIVFINALGHTVGRLGVEDGMPEKSVVSLLLDRRGRVWAATANGVAVISPEDKKILTLYKHNGLAGDSYTHGKLFYEDEKNNIYIGGISGLSIVPGDASFDGMHINTINVEFLGLKIFNQRMHPNGDGSPLTVPLAETKNIQLAHSQNVFSIEFGAINHKVGERLVYEYRMEGLTSHWSQATNQAVSFSNLNPGNYRFMVRAHEPGIFDPADYSVLNIEIKPAPWLSNTAKVMYGLIFLFASYAIYAARVLQIKKREAENAADAKTEFFATMSHEIRTPLTGVLGMLAFALKDGSISEQTLGRLNIAKASAKTLLGITNDILDITKIEAGKLTPENIGFDLGTLLKRTVDAFQLLARQKDLMLSLEIEDGVPRYVKGDPTRLTQVVEKLVGNAIKFTREGHVRIIVKMAATDLSARDGAWLHFSVEDSGIGMAPENIGRLFVKFSQADISNTRESGGTGLGLAISRHLIELMGGKISVVSDLDKGSKFEFTLPLVVAETNDAEVDLDAQRHQYRLKILCAEDFVTNQLIIASLIDEMGHQLTIVEDGVAAINALSEKEFDLILMDGRMPVLDGVEATKIIRSGVWQGKNIVQKDVPILALTASSSEEDFEKLTRAGVTGLILKPIDYVQLFRAVDRVIKGIVASGIELPLMPSTDAIKFTDSKESISTTVDEFVDDSYSSISTRIANRPSSGNLHERLLMAFQASLTEKLEELAVAREQLDFESLGRIYHGIKGGAAHLGDANLADICGQLETASDSHHIEEIDRIRPIFEETIEGYLNALTKGTKPMEGGKK
jgi:signal transduction histidine kinase/ligand-binding sensor domain-containing protein/DNA-binding NarL/FixJ family response regulator